MEEMNEDSKKNQNLIIVLKIIPEIDLNWRKSPPAQEFNYLTSLLLPAPNEIVPTSFETDAGIVSSIRINKEMNFYLQNIDKSDYIIENFTEELRNLENIRNLKKKHDSGENAAKFSFNINFQNCADAQEIEGVLNLDAGYLENLSSVIKESEEAYSISINSDIILLQSSARQGLFYAIQTFLQILQLSAETLWIPTMEIIDYPSMKIRGIADDITRGQVPTLEAAKRYIYLLSKYKMNTYALGYEQDFFKFKQNPILKPYKEGYSAEEIKELDEYAKKRFVDLVPIYTSFGHQDNLLYLPQYQDLGEFPGSQCFDITDPRIYELMESHYKELSEVFSSKTFHMGCDESFDLGFFKSKKYLKETGTGPALLKHYTKMYEMAKNMGKENIIIYHDIVANYMKELQSAPKDLHLMYWEYTPKKHYKKVESLAKTGLPIILSPSHLNWCRNFPDFLNASKNIINLIEEGKKVNRILGVEPRNSDESNSDESNSDDSNFNDSNSVDSNSVDSNSVDINSVDSNSVDDNSDAPNSELHGVVGQLNSTWGDYTNYNLHENNIYGSILSAAASWTENKTDVHHFLKSFAANFFGISDEKRINEFAHIIWETSELIKMFKLRGTMVPQPFYLHLFRNPFYSLKPGSFVKNPKKLLSKCNDLSTRIDNFNNEIKSNSFYVDYLKISIKFAALLASKEMMQKKVAKLCKSWQSKGSEVNEGNSDKKEVISQISTFMTELDALKSEYERLWLLCAKRPVLDFQLGRFNNLKRYCSDKINQINKNVFFRDPFLKSKWITSKKSASPPEGVFFRKEFNVEGKLLNAKLMVMAGDYCIVYVNGVKIGEVYSRMSLSFVPIKERLQIFDVTNQINLNGEGLNVIAIETYNYLHVQPSTNVLLRLSVENEGVESVKDIKSDSTWKMLSAYNPNNPDSNVNPPGKKLSQIPENWNKLVLNEIEKTGSSGELTKSNWIAAKSLGAPPKYNGHVYDEDILNGDIPYTDDYYGFNSQTYGMIYTMFGPLAAKISKPLFGIVKKFLKID